MKKIALMMLIAAVFVLYGWADFDILSMAEGFKDSIEQNPYVSAMIFFVAYVVVTAFSLPVAALLTLLGGALFGLTWGLFLISFASTLGATLAFLLARTILRDWVQERFSQELANINRGVATQGAYYLFSLRLIPAVPFFVINLAFALTPMKTWTFYWVSQIGMLAGTAVFVNAGAELGSIETLNVSGILTPGLIGSFILLAAFPYVLKLAVSKLETRRLYRSFSRPKSFDTNVVVIGAGAAGLVSAYIAAAVKAKVTLIEKNKMGGDCLNTGCVPSKSLINSARLAQSWSRASELGLPSFKVSANINFSNVMAKVQDAITAIEPHDSVARYQELGVDCEQGEAKIISPWQVEVNGRVISTKNIIIATGAAPRVPKIEGLEDIDYLTSESLWSIKERPKRLLIMGGGPIGCELAQAFSRLGSKVVLVGRADRLLPRDEDCVSEQITNSLKLDGVEVITSAQVESFTKRGSVSCAHIGLDGDTKVIEFDRVLVAVGRVARTQDFSELEFAVNSDGTLAVNEYLQTQYPNIYACGDLVGPYQFTHVASHQAWYAAVNALFGGFKKFKVDYRVIPRVTFTSPEVASVGITEREAKDQNIAYELTRYDLQESDRAITEEQTTGFLQVITPVGSDKVLGVSIVAEHAGEMLPEWVLAMKYGLGLNKILGTIHAYPTWNEANKALSGSWKKNHVHPGIMSWLERLHRWRR